MVEQLYKGICFAPSIFGNLMFWVFWRETQQRFHHIYFAFRTSIYFPTRIGFLVVRGWSATAKACKGSLIYHWNAWLQLKPDCWRKRTRIAANQPRRRIVFKESSGKKNKKLRLNGIRQWREDRVWRKEKALSDADPSFRCPFISLNWNSCSSYHVNGAEGELMDF